jgi:hypothetical protein
MLVVYCVTESEPPINSSQFYPVIMADLLRRVTLYCIILLYCVQFTLRFSFAAYGQLLAYVSLYCNSHYMFRPKWPSSSVHVATLKESAVLLFYCNCLKLTSRWYCASTCSFMLLFDCWLSFVSLCGCLNRFCLANNRDGRSYFASDCRFYVVYSYITCRIHVFCCC